MMLRMDEYKDDLSFLNSMKEYKLRGYNRIKRFIIDMIIFLLRDAIPICGAVMAMSAVIGTVSWLVVDNMILLLFLAVIALFILMSVQYLISKIISVQAEKLYGRQELYLINRISFTVINFSLSFLNFSKASSISSLALQYFSFLLQLQSSSQ